MMLVLLFAMTLLLLAAAGLLWWRARELGREQAFYLGRRAGRGGVVQGGRPQPDVLNRMLQGFVLRAGIDAEHLPRWFAPALGLALLGVLLLALSFGLVLGLLALVLLALAVFIWTLARESSRQHKMREQLPGFLEHMMRVLNAGNSLEEALAAATADCPEPLGNIFRRVSRQVRLGAAVDETLTEVAELSGLKELQVMALATRINRRFGGSLKRIFRSLVAAIHQQDAARREMRALTAETRVSAVVLAAVPVLMMLYILSQNPEYYAQMWSDPLGRGFIFGAALLQLAGVGIIWRMLARAGQEA